MSPSATTPISTSKPIPSALTTLINSTSASNQPLTHAPHYHHLAIQILHNLQYQHDWTALQIHTLSPLRRPAQPPHTAPPSRPEDGLATTLPDSPGLASQSGDDQVLLPRPLISGLPPHRIYVHPDEQIEMLTSGVKESDVPKEREWVLPTHIREKWSLRAFAEIFDGVGLEPPGMEPPRLEPPGIRDEVVGESEDGEDVEGWSARGKRRRGGKRVLLATVSDDSTIVYYIVHDGMVKPRQN